MKKEELYIEGEKHFLRRHLKKIVLIFSLVSFLLVGVYQRYKAAEAFALPLDMLGNLVFEMTMYTAGLAAGEKKEDILEENPYKGTENPTVNNARENYVKECFPETTFKLKMGFNDTNYSTFIAGMGAIWANGSYIISKDFCNKIWDNLPTDGTGALNPKDVFLTKDNATILQFPNLNNDENDDENDDDDSETEDDPELSEDDKIVQLLFDPEEMSLSASVFSGILTTKFFSAIYRTLININGSDMEESLEGAENVGCDYSWQWWMDNPCFIDILYQGVRYNFSFKGLTYPTSYDLSGFRIYPLSFKDEKYAQSYFYGFACTDDLEKANTHVTVSTNFYDGELHGVNLGEADLWCPYAISVNDKNDIQNIWGQKNVLDGVTAYVHAPNVIEVGSRENYEKFCEYVSSGDYTLAELLNLMQKGWKVQIKNNEKEWEGIKNQGKTAKQTLEDPEKGKKYQTETGKISMESLDQGLSVQTDPKHGQPLYEFLGDPTEGTELELQPGTETSPGTQPGTSTGNETVGTSEDIGVIGATFPNVGSAWWGGEYAPVNDPDSSQDTDPGDTVDPDNKDGDDGSSEKEPEDNLPFVPGAVSGSDPYDASNVQWYQRFPFCIPWDIYRVISMFDKPAVEPKFSIPFEIRRLGIKESVTVDLTKFEALVEVVRVFTLLSYVTGLIMITRNVIKG